MATPAKDVNSGELFNALRTSLFMWLWGDLKELSVEDRPQALLALIEKKAVPLILQFGFPEEDAGALIGHLVNLIFLSVCDKNPGRGTWFDSVTIEFSRLVTKMAEILSKQGIPVKTDKLESDYWSVLAKAWCLVESDDEAERILDFLSQSLKDPNSLDLIWELVTDAIRANNSKAPLRRLEHGYMTFAFCLDDMPNFDLAIKLLNALSIGWAKRLSSERLRYLMVQSAKVDDEQCHEEVEQMKTGFEVNQFAKRACRLLGDGYPGLTWRVDRVTPKDLGSLKLVYLVGACNQDPPHSFVDVTYDSAKTAQILEPLRTQAESLNFGIYLSLQMTSDKRGMMSYLETLFVSSIGK